MTLPSEGINPWRAHTAPSGHAPVNLPPQDLGRQNRLDGGAETLSETDAGDREFKAFGDDGFTFWDLIDIVNPLQHIPVVSTLYRDMTEDQLDPGSRVLGSTLFMGPIGLATSLVNVVVEHNTGQDVGEHVMAYFRDDSQPLNGQPKTASTEPVAAGTDGVDPVTAWAQQQNAFYQDGGAAGGSEGDQVLAWARAQNAYYRGQADAAQTTQTTDVSDWAQRQNAYYQGGNSAEPAAQPAPATQVADVSAWAQQQNAYYQGRNSAEPAAQVAATQVADVSAWAERQNAYYRKTETVGSTQTASADGPAAPAGSAAIDVNDWAAGQHAYYQGRGVDADYRQTASAEPVAAGTDGIDPVSQWAREEAVYRGGQQAAQQETGGAASVSDWAQSELAWIHGDRAREIAQALPANTAGQTSRTDADKDRERASGGRENGWFHNNMVAGWSKYQEARH